MVKKFYYSLCIDKDMNATFLYFYKRPFPPVGAEQELDDSPDYSDCNEGLDAISELGFFSHGMCTFKANKIITKKEFLEHMEEAGFKMRLTLQIWG